MFSMCLRRFSQPRPTAAASGRLSADVSLPVIGMPPCSFRARREQTMTAAAGTRPAAGHLMSNSFSAPISDPKPLSVTT